MTRQWMTRFGVACGVGLALLGCGTAQSVATSHWHSPDLLLVGYVTTEDGTQRGGVKVCHRQPDNTLVCADDAGLRARLIEPLPADSAPGSATP